MLDVLHWLPLQQRISYRIISLIWRSLLGLAPAYLRDLSHTTMGIPGRRSLRSTEQGLLLVPFCNRNRNLKTSKALLKSQAHQGTSLFTSAATNQRGFPKGGQEKL